jgi:hypothetical protein
VNTGAFPFPVRDPLPPVVLVTADLCPEKHLYAFTFDGEPMTTALDALEDAVLRHDGEAAADIAADLVMWVASSVNEAVMEYILSRVTGRTERRGT